MKVTGPQAIYVPADGELEIGDATGCIFTGDIPRELLDLDKDRRKRLADDVRLQREAYRTAMATARTEIDKLRRDVNHAESRMIRAENRISAKNSIIIGLGALLGMAGVVIIFALAVA